MIYGEHGGILNRKSGIDYVVSKFSRDFPPPFFYSRIIPWDFITRHLWP